MGENPHWCGFCKKIWEVDPFVTIAYCPECRASIFPLVAGRHGDILMANEEDDQ